MLNSGGASRKTTEDIMFHPCHIAGVLAVMTAGVMGSVSVAQSAPYDLKWYYDDLVEVKRLDFIVLTDQLEITDVIVNKGNCPIATTFDGAVELSVNDAVQKLGEVLAGQEMEPLQQTSDPAEGLPLSGVYGESLSVFVGLSCNILLVEIITSEGEWSSQFKP
jgi:hypothetical protein